MPKKKLEPKLINTFATPYDNWCEAFSLCREAGRPLLVAIHSSDGLDVAEVFPSGHRKMIRFEPCGFQAAISKLSEPSPPTDKP